MSKRKRIYSALIALIVLIVAAVSAWWFLIVLGPESPSSRIWSVSWLGLTIGFTLFWVAILYAVYRFGYRMTRQQGLTTTIGTIVFGLTGLLLMTPAGLSTSIIKVYADNVWAPNIFTAIWTANDSHQYVPLNLPTAEPTSLTLDIISEQDNPGEIWLLNAVWPNESVIPVDQFETDGGWELRRIDWGSYEDQSIWVSPQSHQSAVLHWKGMAPGPLTLLFLKHQFSGEVVIRWGDGEQTINLNASETEFQGVTLPINEPSVWQANLPVHEVAADGIHFLVEPNPGGKLPVIIKKIKITGVPGQTLEFTGERLFEALRVKHGHAELTPEGIRFVQHQADITPKFALVIPKTSNFNLSTTILWLERGLVFLYLASIGGVIFFNLARLLPTNILANANTITMSIIISLLIGEIALRLYLPSDKYYVWLPNLYRVFKPIPAAVPGVDGEGRFIINSEGIRGDEFSPDDDYRILTIGGSTTENVYLDQAEAWPQILQDELNNSIDLQVWVGNVGKSGHSTREHLLQMQYLLPQYPDLDAVIMLVGINDLSLRLEQDNDYDPNYPTTPSGKQRLMNRAFGVLPRKNPNWPYYTQSTAWQLVDRIRQSQVQVSTAKEIDIQDNAGRNILVNRAARAKAEIRDELPDLSSSLGEYTRNLNSIIDIAEADDVRLILMTQPTLWRTDLKDTERELLWFGKGPGQKFYYAVEPLIRGISMYNETLLEVCNQRQIECIDLANALPKDLTVFYDDVHFNESGSAQVAEVVVNYMLRYEPFPSHNLASEQPGE